MDPEFMRKQADEQGGDPVDLGKSESWSVLENANSENANSVNDFDFGLFNLPELPPVDLSVGIPCSCQPGAAPSSCPLVRSPFRSTSAGFFGVSTTAAASASPSST